MLQRLNTSPKAQLYTLTVCFYNFLITFKLLDACVKNTTDLFHVILTKPKNMAILESLALTATSQVAARTKEVLAEWSKDYGKKIPQYSLSYSKVTGSSVKQQPLPSAAHQPQPSAPPMSVMSQQPAVPPPQQPAVCIQLCCLYF